MTRNKKRSYTLHESDKIIRVGDKTTSKSILDQIDGVTVVSLNKITRYLRDKYQLTPEEYYIKVALNGVPPECHREGCHNKPHFIGLIPGFNKYCSKECRNAEALLEYHKSGWTEEHLRSLSKATRNYQSKLVEDGSHNFLHQSPEHKFHAQLESAKFTFINNCKSKGISLANLYIGVSSQGLVKIGITSKPISIRCSYLGLISYHLLRVDTPDVVAEIEYQVKKTFSPNYYTGCSSEYYEYSKLHEIINFIRTLTI